MEKKYGIVKEVYIPVINNQDVMVSDKIGFVIEVDSKLYNYETEQNEEVADIMKNDKVEITIQIIDNHKFVDIRKFEGD